MPGIEQAPKHGPGILAWSWGFQNFQESGASTGKQRQLARWLRGEQLTARGQREPADASRAAFVRVRPLPAPLGRTQPTPQAPRCNPALRPPHRPALPPPLQANWIPFHLSGPGSKIFAVVIRFRETSFIFCAHGLMLRGPALPPSAPLGTGRRFPVRSAVQMWIPASPFRPVLVEMWRLLGPSELQEQPGSVSLPVMIRRGGSVDGRRPWARTTAEPLRFPQAQLGACWATLAWVPGVPRCLEPSPSPAPAGVPILLKMAFLVVCGCLSWESFTKPKESPTLGKITWQSTEPASQPRQAVSNAAPNRSPRPHYPSPHTDTKNPLT